MTALLDNKVLRKAVRWLKRRGFVVEEGRRRADPFNAGIWLDGDCVVYAPDEAHPGDLLHEAGHLAVLPSCIREVVGPGDIETFTAPAITKYMQTHPNAFGYPEDSVARACMQAGDAEVIAWAYAAAIDAKIDPWLTCVKGFGDQEAGEATFIGLKVGRYLGINGLRTAGFMDSTNDFPKLKFWRHPA